MTGALLDALACAEGPLASMIASYAGAGTYGGGGGFIASRTGVGTLASTRRSMSSRPRSAISRSR